MNNSSLKKLLSNFQTINLIF